MDKYLVEQLNATYPNKNSSYKISRGKMQSIMVDIHTYSYFSALDDIFSIIRDNPELTKDELIGEMHLMIIDKMKEVKGLNYYKIQTMKSVEWLLDYSSKKVN